MPNESSLLINHLPMQKQLQQQAEEQRSLYENRQKLWEQEKQAALNALHQQIEVERRTQMARLRRRS